MTASQSVARNRDYRALAAFVAANPADAAGRAALTDWLIEHGYTMRAASVLVGRVADREARRVRRAIRAAVGTTDTRIPVEIVDGDAAPVISGESWHYTTPAGQPVRYPNAYRRAYGKPVYHCSTRAITVGRDWVAANIV